MEYVKIEWSGYWDFPTGTYSGGDKNGDFYSGSFDSKIIDLESIGSIVHEIEPGKPTFPRSTDASFSIFNRNIDTGEKIYDFTDISTLGRTVEYGGRDDGFGDLFVKISIPLLNDKVIYKGVVDGVDFSKYDNKVKFNCTDFVGSLSTYKESLFKKYSYREAKFDQIAGQTLTGQETAMTTPETINQFYGVQQAVEDVNGNVVEAESIRLEVIKPESETLSQAETAVADWDTNNLDTDPDYQAFLKGFIKRTTLDHPLFRRVFSDNYDFNELSKSYNFFTDQDFSGAQRFNVVANMQSPKRTGFVQIGKDTILTRYYLTINVLSRWINTATSQVVSTIAFKVSVLHMKNGNITIKSDEDNLVVYERGRYLKDESDPAESDYKLSDTAKLVIHDSKYYPVENDISFSIGDNWEQKSEYGITDLDNSYVFGGFFFENQAGVFVPKSEYGYFNNVVAFSDEVSGNLLGDFVKDKNFDQLIKYDKADMNVSAHNFISDIAIYGWASESFSDILVNNARQLNSYLYANEEGFIIYHDRRHHVKIDASQSGNDFFLINREYMSRDSPSEYRYGSPYYSVEYNDIIEVNNIKSESEFSSVVGESGRVNRFASPEDLTVSNYRTSDLGVPDQRTINAAEEVNENYLLLRTSPSQWNEPTLNDFSPTPEDQAKRYAQAFPYPNNVFSLNIDILKNPALGYDKISIGSYLYEPVENMTDIFNAYLVKSISYDPSLLLKDALSVKVKLLYVGEITIPIYELTEDTITVTENRTSSIDPAPSLADPVFNAPQFDSGGCQVLLDWEVASGADSYELQEAEQTNSAPVWNTIYDGSSTAYNHNMTGYATATPSNLSIDYRVRSKDSVTGTTGNWVNQSINNIDISGCAI